MHDKPHRVAIESVWDTISFPQTTLLGKRVPKKQFIESGQLSTSDKKLFQATVKNIYWQYTLKPSTCPLLPYRDNEREYLEVAVLQVEINGLSQVKTSTTKSAHHRIAEIIHRIIPYPLLLSFYTETDEIALSIAPKRFSQAEQGAFVVERFYTTGWINLRALNNNEAAFIASLPWDTLLTLSMKTYGDLYNAWMDRFTGYECSVLSGSFTLGSASRNRLVQLTRCREIESKILELRGQLKKAAFNRQVELNTQIKTFEQELKLLVKNL